ncbi:MAG: RHS repeat-associated core domain-containing protein [Pyrinomonadaceae bacterium]
MLRDLDGSGATTADYLNGPGIDNKLRQTISGTASYFLADHLGTTRSLTDASGNITSSLGYDSFGNVTSGSAATRYTYTNREIDSDVSLIHYRARWYDFQQGRFISEDPIGLLGGVNPFAYVANNPANAVDPLGLYAGVDDAAMLIGGAVVGLAGQDLETSSRENEVGGKTTRARPSVVRWEAWPWSTLALLAQAQSAD